MRRWIPTLLLGACATLPAAPEPPPDPALGYVALSAAPGWNASLVLDNGRTGIWTVKALPVFPMFGCPDVVGLDDLGRCHVLSSYSGKWTPHVIVHDLKWLGGLALADVDPRVPGKELYTGGQRGNLFEIVAYDDETLDCRRVTNIPGREIHTLVAADFEPGRADEELLVFTRPGGLYILRASEAGLELAHLQDLEGRVHDAILLPGDPPTVATVSRAGKLELLRIGPGGPEWTTVHERAMGMGRLAMRPVVAGKPLVLYTTCDDGCILRHERGADGSFSTDLIHAGRQGPRGLAAGRFGADPDEETVAIFGYSADVELLTRGATGWRVETIFTDRDKGHWLSAAELDGRNGTHELLCSGYGGRIVQLARPPEFALQAQSSRKPR
ncbi:MAG: hypothetical protein ACT4PV_02420 [Planctomycetaceae bacterium]